METSSMMDVIHFYFEEDSRFATAEQIEAVSRMRTELYKLYGTTYKYAVKSSGKMSSSSGRKYINDSEDSSDFDLAEFDPNNQEVKEYVEPTEFNPDSSMPFGSVLDAPLG
jgi:hypothetical protein